MTMIPRQHVDGWVGQEDFCEQSILKFVFCYLKVQLS